MFVCCCDVHKDVDACRQRQRVHRVCPTGAIKGLPIIMDEAQVLLTDTPSGESLFRTATRVMAIYANSVAAPVVLIVSGTSFVLKDMQPHLASGLLKPSQTLPTMAPSPLTSDDVADIVRKVLQRKPPAAVGELLRGRGRFVMTFLTEVLRVEIADPPRARTQPAPAETRASKRARTAAPGCAAGAGAALDVAVGGSGDGGVPVAKLDLRQRGAAEWLEQLANAERLILFGGRSYVEYLTRVVAEFCATAQQTKHTFAVMIALANVALTAAL